MNIRRHLMLLLLVTMGVLVTACSDSTEVGGQRGVSDTEIRIGMHTDLSGPLALTGVAIANGARLKFEEVNAAGGIHGRQIKLIVEDSQYQVPRAIQAANKLVRRDDIFAMLLGIGTPMNNAIMPMLFENGVLNLFPASGARSMSEPFNELQFVAMDQYYLQIRTAMNHYIQNEGKTRPCVIYQDSDFGQEIFDGAQAELEALGIEMAAVSSHKPTDTEFTTTIMRLRNAGCDLVALGTIHKDTILVAEAARKLGWQGVQWVGTTALILEAVASVESGATEGLAAFVQNRLLYPDDPDLDPAIADWYQRFEERFGMLPEWTSVESYRLAEILVHALELAGPDLTAQALINALESLDDYTDMFGVNTSFGPGDHFAPTRAYLAVVKDKRWANMPESFEY